MTWLLAGGSLVYAAALWVAGADDRGPDDMGVPSRGVMFGVSFSVGVIALGWSIGWAVLA